MPKVSTMGLGRELCKIFGLDPTNVYGVQLEVYPESAVAIVIRRFVDENELDRLQEVLARYDLVPRDETNL